MAYVTEQVQELYPHNNPRIAAQITKPIKHSELGMLEKIGFSADVADNGQEGLDRLAAETFDLVLIDCGMPAWTTTCPKNPLKNTPLRRKSCSGCLPGCPSCWLTMPTHSTRLRE